MSTEEQKEGQTIESQIKELETFAKSKDWLVSSVYRDEGWSGGILARPDLDHLRDDAGKALFDVVLINDVDRLARDVSHLGIIKRDLERRGVQVIFRKLPAENSPTHNLMVNILGSFAEFERELILDRTRRGRRHKAEVKKQYVGCIAPYGYRYITAEQAGGSGRLEIDPEQAVIVKQMYHWVADEALSTARVAERLTRNGVLTRKGNKKWGVSSAYKILRNETYIGSWAYGKHESCEPLRPRRSSLYKKHFKTSRRPRPKSEWLTVTLPEDLRIIDRDLWSRVQAQISANPKFSPRNTNHFYLLQGLLRCGKCRNRYSGTFCFSCGKVYHYYRCNKRCAESRWIRREHLDKAVWTSVEQVILDPRKFVQRVTTAYERLKAELRNSAKSRGEVEHALGRIDLEEARFLHAYKNGSMSATQLGKQLEELNTRRAAMLAEKVSLASSPAEPDEMAVDTISEFCSKLSSEVQNATPEVQQSVLRRLVEEIIIEDRTTARIVAQVPQPDAERGHGEPRDRIGASVIASPPSQEYGSKSRSLSFELVTHF